MADLVHTRLPDHIANPRPEIYEHGSYVVLDFETTTFNKGLATDPRNSILLSSYCAVDLHEYRDTRRTLPDIHSCWGTEYEQRELVERIEAAGFLVAHNCKFELGWLERCGLDLTKVVVWDTQIGEYVLGGNKYQYGRLSLEQCAQRRLGEGKVSYISKMIKNGVDTRDIPRSWLQTYCEKDVDLCHRLFLKQRELMLKDRKLLAVQYTRCLATPVLCDIEKNGMQLDGNYVKELYDKEERAYAEAERELSDFTGGINQNSPKQLAEYLYDDLEFPEIKDRRGNPLRTPTGAKSTGAEIVGQLRATNKRQRQFKELYAKARTSYTALTKYVRHFRRCVDENGGHLRGQFNQCNTQTHRLSSSGLEYSVQFQNFPRAYKPAFTTRNAGWSVGEADGAQLEFRVAAHLGRDETALDDIVQGRDVHAVTADIIGVSRQDAKAHTFKPLYAGTSGTPNEVRYYKYFQERYGGITEQQQEWVNSVLENKELRTEQGLIYYWPYCRMTNSGYITHTTNICNYPVQGLATAEIIPIAFVYFWHYVKALGLQMLLVNTVHDSIIAEIPPEEVDLFHELAQLCLIDKVYEYLKDVYEINFTVPLGAGVSIGSHWGNSEAKENEITYNAKEELYATG